MSRMKNKSKYDDTVSNGKPEWYWSHGLHDAEIVEANDLQLSPDYKQTTPLLNCLELVIDARGTLFDTSIRKISLYNYKILSGSIEELKEKKIWWISDTIQSSDSNFLLNIEFEKPNGDRFTLQIEFLTAVVERK